MQSGCSHQTGMPSLGPALVRYNRVLFLVIQCKPWCRPTSRDRQRGQTSGPAEVGPSAAIVQQIMEAHGGVVEGKKKLDPGCDPCPEVLTNASGCQLRLVRRSTANHTTSARGVLVPGARPVTCTPADPAFPKTTLNSATQPRHRNRDPGNDPERPHRSHLIERRHPDVGAGDQ